MQRLGIPCLGVAVMLSLATAAAAHPHPGIVSDSDCDPGVQTPSLSDRRMVYLEFDGVTISRSETDADARGNFSLLVNSNVAIPAFNHGDLTDAHGMTREEVIDYVISQLPMLVNVKDVEFTTSRPTQGSYYLIAFGGDSWSVLGQPWIPGISVVDDGDCASNNIGFVFPLGLSLDDLAPMAAHALGHAMGLSHVDDTERVCDEGGTCWPTRGDVEKANLGYSEEANLGCSVAFVLTRARRTAPWTLLAALCLLLLIRRKNPSQP